MVVPATIQSGAMAANNWSFSAGMYQTVEMPNPNCRLVSELIDGYQIGSDPGSVSYMRVSPAYLIRTKALQDHTCLLSPKGGSFVPLNPRALPDVVLKKGDILLAKDSNVGACSIVTEDMPNHSISGGIVRLIPRADVDRHYLFAFLKHPILKTQLFSMVPRGATIAHAKTLWLNCKIPFPAQPDAENVIRYVSALSRAIIEKELAIRRRNQEIDDTIEKEMASKQSPETFVYSEPSSHDIRVLGRLDAAIYSSDYKEKIWPVLNYTKGYETPSSAGFTVTPGPSLEIKLLGTRLDSDVQRPGFYTLLIPANISEWGTMSRIAWLGTKKKLALLRKGDVLIGEAGFQKGRSIVLIDAPEFATTNAHGLYLRREDEDIVESIYFRCIFNWYRSQGLIDLMAVGGSGGHFSPEYFEFVLIPKFPRTMREKIARLYHCPAVDIATGLRADQLVEAHAERNSNLGIWELDTDLQKLRASMADIQHAIIHGQSVKIDAY
ncbi:hypothetical protein BSU04_25980 [Caballeronia sordidicola]|uniref:Type I restriction-modification system, specificity subunit S n=1 Tax=Caballeronia sordidicola TaxID=196367 RepID=A0A226WX41_CABSO|nr:hypothetical protein BSU04_25980 [Caballeronia sordidicola]